MPPSSPLLAAVVAMRIASSHHARCLVSISIVSLLACSVFALSAGAETPDTVTKTKSPARSSQSLVPPRAHRRTSLLLQTRYTVRKQIESIEPVSWLERYGEVRVRKIER